MPPPITEPLVRAPKKRKKKLKKKRKLQYEKGEASAVNLDFFHALTADSSESEAKGAKRNDRKAAGCKVKIVDSIIFASGSPTIWYATEKYSGQVLKRPHAQLFYENILHFFNVWAADRRKAETPSKLQKVSDIIAIFHPMNPQADPELLPLRMVYLTDRTLKPYLRGEITDNEANNLIHRSDGASMNYLDAKLKQLSRLDQKVEEDEHFGYRTGVLQYFPWPYSDFNEMLRVCIKPEKKRSSKRRHSLAPPMGVGMGMRIFSIERKKGAVPIIDVSSFAPGKRGQTWDILGATGNPSATPVETIKVEEEALLLELVRKSCYNIICHLASANETRDRPLKFLRLYFKLDSRHVLHLMWCDKMVTDYQEVEAPSEAFQSVNMESTMELGNMSIYPEGTAESEQNAPVAVPPEQKTEEEAPEGILSKYSRKYQVWTKSASPAELREFLHEDEMKEFDPSDKEALVSKEYHEHQLALQVMASTGKGLNERVLPMYTTATPTRKYGSSNAKTRRRLAKQLKAMQESSQNSFFQQVLWLRKLYDNGTDEGVVMSLSKEIGIDMNQLVQLDRRELELFLGSRTSAASSNKSNWLGRFGLQSRSGSEEPNRLGTHSRTGSASLALQESGSMMDIRASSSSFYQPTHSLSDFSMLESSPRTTIDRWRDRRKLFDQSKEARPDEDEHEHEKNDTNTEDVQDTPIIYDSSQSLGPQFGDQYNTDSMSKHEDESILAKETSKSGKRTVPLNNNSNDEVNDEQDDNIHRLAMLRERDVFKLAHHREAKLKGDLVQNMLTHYEDNINRVMSDRLVEHADSVYGKQSARSSRSEPRSENNVPTEEVRNARERSGRPSARSSRSESKSEQRTLSREEPRNEREHSERISEKEKPLTAGTEPETNRRPEGIDRVPELKETYDTVPVLYYNKPEDPYTHSGKKSKPATPEGTFASVDHLLDSARGGRLFEEFHDVNGEERDDTAEAEQEKERQVSAIDNSPKRKHPKEKTFARRSVEKALRSGSRGAGAPAFGKSLTDFVVALDDIDGATSEVKKQRRFERRIRKQRRKALHSAFKMIRSHRRDNPVDSKGRNTYQSSRGNSTMQISEDMVSELPSETQKVVRDTFKEIYANDMKKESFYVSPSNVKDEDRERWEEATSEQWEHRREDQQALRKLEEDRLKKRLHTAELPAIDQEKYQKLSGAENADSHIRTLQRRARMAFGANVDVIWAPLEKAKDQTRPKTQTSANSQKHSRSLAHTSHLPGNSSYMNESSSVISSIGSPSPSASVEKSSPFASKLVPTSKSRNFTTGELVAKHNPPFGKLTPGSLSMTTNSEGEEEVRQFEKDQEKGKAREVRQQLRALRLTHNRGDDSVENISVGPWKSGTESPQTSSSPPKLRKKRSKKSRTALHRKQDVDASLENDTQNENSGSSHGEGSPILTTPLEGIDDEKTSIMSMEPQQSQNFGEKAPDTSADRT